MFIRNRMFLFEPRGREFFIGPAILMFSASSEGDAVRIYLVENYNDAAAAKEVRRCVLPFCHNTGM